MTTNFKRTFGNATSPLALSYLDDNFAQLEAAGTSTVTLSGAQLIGFMQSGSGATSTTVQAEIRRIFYPEQFGAVGDGSTDDTTAISSANTAASDKGGIVQFLNKTYKFTSQLTPAARVKWKGKGVTNSSDAADRGTTLLKSGNFDGIALSSAAAGLEDLTVEGDTGNGGSGIVISGGRVLLRNVGSHKHAVDGIKVDGSGSNANVWRMDRVITLGNTRNGVYVHDSSGSTPNSNAGLLTGLDTRSNGGDGLKVENAIDNLFLGVVSQLNTGQGIHLASGAHGNQFFGYYTESNTAGQVILDSGATKNIVFGYRSGVTSDQVTNNGGDTNVILGRFTSPTDINMFRTVMGFAEIVIKNTAISGDWKIGVDGTTRDLEVTLENTTANAVLELDSSSSGTVGLRVNARNGIYKGAYVGGATVNHGTVGANSHADATVTVTGARDQMKVISHPRQAAGLPTGLIHASSWISADDTVTIRLYNVTGSGVASNIAWTVAVLDLNT